MRKFISLEGYNKLELHWDHSEMFLPPVTAISVKDDDVKTPKCPWTESTRLNYYTNGLVLEHSINKESAQRKGRLCCVVYKRKRINKICFDAEGNEAWSEIIQRSYV
ncbi:hypothetical protein VNO77_16422 [Canavalia gladiata]|uniref:Uncharacterized protein n=1 Tax=Canavalia gladiata TaxID=3824 RepID=A0AAN9M100_CANGL